MAHLRRKQYVQNVFLLFFEVTEAVQSQAFREVMFQGNNWLITPYG
jgi:hypothetical protein